MHQRSSIEEIVKLATNAPAHWPAVEVATWDTAKTWNNTEPVAFALDKGFTAARTPCPILIFGSRFQDEGVLEVPIQVTDRGQKYCVFLYASNAPESSAAFAAARRLVQAEGAKAVYYAPAPLAPASPGPVCQPFRSRYMAGYGKPAPAGKYALWWATDSDKDFLKSKTFELIDGFYKTADGMETWILADLLQALGHGKGERTGLPETSIQVPMYGPEERLVIFGASPKGLRFFFPIETTPPVYRDLFWKNVTDWAQRFKADVQRAGASLDPDAHRHGLKWWNFFLPTMKQVDPATPMEMVGPLWIKDQ